MNSRLMDIGFIGAGAVAQKLALLAVQAGRVVVISNSRGPGTLNDLTKELGLAVQAGSVGQAAMLDTVILAIPWPATGPVLDSLPTWDGRILIDATNHFLNYPEVADIGYATASELIAERAPGARVVKTFNGLHLGNYDPQPGEEGRRVMLIASDHPDAADSVRELVDAMGFFPVVFDTLRDGRLFQVGGPLSDVPLGHI
jgi:8-hydroxy-5-deazaflavin:NADPH oxidoreductase